MLEYLSVNIPMLLIMAIYYAVIGGAFAAGAWVVWRVLEQLAARPIGGETSGLRRYWWLLALVIAGAIWFAVGTPARQTGIERLPDGGVVFREGSKTSVVPLIALLAMAAGVVWLVRKALHGPKPPQTRPPG